MQLTTLDWLVIAGCLTLAFGPALLFTRRASRGTAEFFATGRSAPWWLLGTSMVATTFATDTPLLVSNLVRTDGVAANWGWWALLLSGMLTVFFYARLWRRSGVLTDLEFYELRYSGRSATAVRAFRALFLGVFINGFILANVTLAMVKIANVMLGWDMWLTLTVCAVLCVGFAAASGLWGVLAADLVQFGIAMAGVIVAAWFSLAHPAVGGLAGMLQQVDPEKLQLLPSGNNLVELLIIPMAVLWWATWYPGTEPGGGSYVAQRILAAKSEQHALGATLWFNIAHYALRPWPWIIVALCSLIVYPDLAAIRDQFPQLEEKLVQDDIAYPAMLTLLPAGAVGLLVASLLSAYISTMSTQLNWASSYLVHDFYRRFLRPDATERHYVAIARLTTALLMGLGVALVPYIESAEAGFKLLLSIGAGTGLVYLLRWYWWRVNAWAEIAAMIACFVATVGLRLYNQQVSPDHALDDTELLLITVAVTTLAWVPVMFLTRPTADDRLVSFYELTRPAGPGWARVRRLAAPGTASPDHPGQAFASWILACVMVYAALFGVGWFVYQQTLAGTAALALAGVTAGALWRLQRRGAGSAPAR